MPSVETNIMETRKFPFSPPAPSSTSLNKLQQSQEKPSSFLNYQDNPGEINKKSSISNGIFGISYKNKQRD